jgi:hypothetical protein
VQFNRRELSVMRGIESETAKKKKLKDFVSVGEQQGIQWQEIVTTFVAAFLKLCR